MPDSYRHRRQLFAIAARQDWKCYWCGWLVTELTVTREHLVPRSRGGKNHKDNIVAACSACNQKRGSAAAPPAGYIARRKAGMPHEAVNVTLRAVRSAEGPAPIDGPTRAEKLMAKRARRAIIKRWKGGQIPQPTLADVWPTDIGTRVIRDLLREKRRNGVQ